MDKIFEVKLTHVALVQAKNSREADRTARNEAGEITSEDACIEVLDEIVSAEELSTVEGNWYEDCLPYGGDGMTTLGELFEKFEAERPRENPDTKTLDMFKTPERKTIRPPDIMSIAARKKLGEGDDWKWFSAEVIRGNKGDLLLKGGVPRILANGQARWRGVACDTVVINDLDIEQAKQDYEHATGKCANCGGSGEQVVAVIGDETRYAKCERCLGTGACLPHAPTPPLKSQAVSDEQELLIKELQMKVEASRLLLKECNDVINEYGGAYIELRAYLKGDMPDIDVISLLGEK